jgi:hypothetical protein
MNQNIEPCKTGSPGIKEEHMPEPDPGSRVAQFIAWLKKRGYIQNYTKCEMKCKHLCLDLEKDILDVLGCEIIGVYTSRGEKLVVLENRTWAQDISRYHGVDIPHHRHHQPW